MAELEKPGRDPRSTFTYAHFFKDIREVSDLKEGLLLEGTVTNVTNFGAFVDIGVHQDGLVHISELSDTFVTDPKKVVHVGQIVKVRVLKVDTVLKRIALSMKSSSEGRRPTPPQEKLKQPDTKANGIFGNKNEGPKKLVTAKPKFNVKQFMR
jgi:uncharacterized protein